MKMTVKLLSDLAIPSSLSPAVVSLPIVVVQTAVFDDYVCNPPQLSIPQTVCLQW